MRTCGDGEEEVGGDPGLEEVRLAIYLPGRDQDGSSEEEHAGGCSDRGDTTTHGGITTTHGGDEHVALVPLVWAKPVDVLVALVSNARARDRALHPGELQEAAGNRT